MTTSKNSAYTHSHVQMCLSYPPYKIPQFDRVFSEALPLRVLLLLFCFCCLVQSVNLFCTFPFTCLSREQHCTLMCRPSKRPGVTPGLLTTSCLQVHRSCAMKPLCCFFLSSTELKSWFQSLVHLPYMVKSYLSVQLPKKCFCS